MTPSLNRNVRLVEAKSAAVAVRVSAFVLSVLSLVSIPAVLVAMTTGRLTLQAALYVVCGAVALIGLAAAAVRPFDPLRQ